MIGKIIKTLREKEGLTQKEFSETLGININTLASYERGNREPPLSVIISLADYFKVSIDFLVGRVKENTFEILNTVSDWKSTFDKVSNIKNFFGEGNELSAMQTLLALNKIADRQRELFEMYESIRTKVYDKESPMRWEELRKDLVSTLTKDEQEEIALKVKIVGEVLQYIPDEGKV